MVSGEYMNLETNNFQKNKLLEFIASEEQETTEIYPNSIVKKRFLGKGTTGLFISVRNFMRQETFLNEDHATAFLALVQNGKIELMNSEAFMHRDSFMEMFPEYPCTEILSRATSQVFFNQVHDRIFSEDFMKWAKERRLLMGSEGYLYNRAEEIIGQNTGIWQDPNWVFDLHPEIVRYPYFQLTAGEFLRNFTDDTYVSDCLFPQLCDQIDKRTFTRVSLLSFIISMAKLKITLDTLNEVLGTRTAESLSMLEEIQEVIHPKIRKIRVFCEGENGSEIMFEVQNPVESLYPYKHNDDPRPYFLGFRVIQCSDPLLISMDIGQLIPWNKIKRIEHLKKTIWKQN